MAQTSRSSPAIGGAVPTHSVSAEDYVPTPKAKRGCRSCNPDPLYVRPYKTTYGETGKES